MGIPFKPLYGEGIKFWALELVNAVDKNDNETTQACLRSLSAFIKNDSKD